MGRSVSPDQAHWGNQEMTLSRLNSLVQRSFSLTKQLVLGLFRSSNRDRSRSHHPTWAENRLPPHQDNNQSSFRALRMLWFPSQSGTERVLIGQLHHPLSQGTSIIDRENIFILEHHSLVFPFRMQMYGFLRFAKQKSSSNLQKRLSPVKQLIHEKTHSFLKYPTADGRVSWLEASLITAIIEMHH